jgi:uncharacterized membrane protein YdjX (TVP38/TMEM64 family)
MNARALVRNPRIWAAVSAVAIVFSSWAIGAFDILSFETLRDRRDELTDWVDANTMVAVVAYLAVYVTVVALSVPCAVLLTLSGGFLFGWALGLPLAVAGSTLGAALLFLLVRRFVGADALAKLGPAGARVAEGIRRDATAFLLALRFAPVVPFFIVNLVPALAGVPLRTYVATTFVGIIPVTAVFAMAGAGLGAVMDSGEALTAAAMLTPEIMACLIGLAVLTLATIPVRRWIERRARAA